MVDEEVVLEFWTVYAILWILSTEADGSPCFQAAHQKLYKKRKVKYTIRFEILHQKANKLLEFLP
jgi:hypothetical protein